MSIDRGIPGGSSQILAISVRNMFTGLRVSEPLGQTEVDDVDVVLLLADTDEEIVRFDVSVEEVSRVHKLNSLELIVSIKYKRKSNYHLISKHQHRF